MNKKGLESRYLILGIIAIAVVAITIAAFLPQIFRLLAFFGKSYDDLAASEKSNMEANFNQLIENIKVCSNIADSGCVCSEKFPGYPQPFMSAARIEIVPEKDQTNITFFYKEYKKEVTIDKTALSKYFSLDCSSYEKNKEFRINYEVSSEVIPLIIEFDKDVPSIKKFSLFSTPFFQLKIAGQPGGISLITYKKDKKCLIEEAAKILAEMPKCLPKRQEAIENFESFIEDIQKEENYGKSYTIKLPQDYSIRYTQRPFAQAIKIEEKLLVLEYKKEPVEKLMGAEATLTEEESKGMKTEEVSTEFKFDVRCAGQEWGYLENGNKIRIKKTAEGSCIEKL